MTTIEQKERDDYVSDLKQKIALAKMLETLRNTPEWQEIVAKGYCDANLKADVYMLAHVGSTDGKAKLAEKIASVGHFQKYLEQIVSNGSTAEASLRMLIEGENQ